MSILFSPYSIPGERQDERSTSRGLFRVCFRLRSREAAVRAANPRGLRRPDGQDGRRRNDGAESGGHVSSAMNSEDEAAFYCQFIMDGWGAGGALFSTGRMGWMSHRKWKESKQQPTMLPGPAVSGCCLISSHFLWAINPIRPVVVDWVGLT